MSEWGKWIQHDGKGCPVAAGTIVEVSFNLGLSNAVGPALSNQGIYKCAGWDWFEDPLGQIVARIIRYRIRRLKAPQQMIERARDLELV